MSSVLEFLRFYPFEIQTYSAWFMELAECGKIKGQVAAEFLKKSGLSTTHLKQVKFSLQLVQALHARSTRARRSNVFGLFRYGILQILRELVLSIRFHLINLICHSVFSLVFVQYLINIKL
jgi:hypothetical protein